MTRDKDRGGAPWPMARGRRLVRAVALVLVALGMPAAAMGHDGITGVFLEPDRVSPGGVIVVRGDNVSTDDPLRVELIAGTTRTELATAATDGEGHFTVGVNIPTELAAGSYAVEIISLSGVQMTAVLHVEGAPIFDPQTGAPAGRDEGLPARPSVGTQGVPVPPATTSSPAGPAGDPASDVDLVPLVALVAAIGGFALFVRWSRRPPSAAAGSTDLP